MAEYRLRTRKLSGSLMRAMRAAHQINGPALYHECDKRIKQLGSVVVIRAQTLDEADCQSITPMTVTCSPLCYLRRAQIAAGIGHAASAQQVANGVSAMGNRRGLG